MSCLLQRLSQELTSSDFVQCFTEFSGLNKTDHFQFVNGAVEYALNASTADSIEHLVSWWNESRD